MYTDHILTAFTNQINFFAITSWILHSFSLPYGVCLQKLYGISGMKQQMTCDHFCLGLRGFWCSDRIGSLGRVLETQVIYSRHKLDKFAVSSCWHVESSMYAFLLKAALFASNAICRCCFVWGYENNVNKIIIWSCSSWITDITRTISEPNNMILVH